MRNTTELARTKEEAALQTNGKSWNLTELPKTEKSIDPYWVGDWAELGWGRIKVKQVAEVRWKTGGANARERKRQSSTGSEAGKKPPSFPFWDFLLLPNHASTTAEGGPGWGLAELTLDTSLMWAFHLSHKAVWVWFSSYSLHPGNGWNAEMGFEEGISNRILIP